MDAIHFHVRSEGRIVKKAVYIAIGIGMNGLKDVLGMWIGENESAKFCHYGIIISNSKNRITMGFLRLFQTQFNQSSL